MGQYFKAINLDTFEQISSPGFSKIMEFSYVGNELPLEVSRLMMPGNQWHKHRVMFVGDYCDNDEKEPAFRQSVLKRLPENLKAKLDKEADNLYSIFDSFPDKGCNGGTEARYIFNYVKQEYVDLKDCPTNKDGYTIHPLCLLTALGNGNGGGDYYGKAGAKYVGYWCGDIICSGNEVDLKKFVKITPGFIEE